MEVLSYMPNLNYIHDYDLFDRRIIGGDLTSKGGRDHVTRLKKRILSMRNDHWLQRGKGGTIALYIVNCEDTFSEGAAPLAFSKTSLWNLFT